MTCNNGVEFIILFSIFSIHLVVNYINSLIICGLRVLNLAIVMNTLSFHVTNNLIKEKLDTFKKL